MKFLLPHFILPIHSEAWSLGMFPGLGYGGMTLMLSRGKAIDRSTHRHPHNPTEKSVAFIGLHGSCGSGAVKNGVTV